jgi:ABC-2 type transport system permease protein
MRGRSPTPALVRVAMLRLVRDRSNIFFVFVFPLLLIVLIGAQFGGEGTPPRLAVSAHGTLADQLVDRIDAIDNLEVDRYDTATLVASAVARGEASAGLVLPVEYDQVLRAGGRQGMVIDFISPPDGSGALLQSRILPVLSEENQRLVLADFVRLITPTEYGAAVAQVDALLATIPPVGVQRVTVGEDPIAEAFGGLGRFDLGAVQQLLLFVFLTSLVSAATILESREYGVTRRLMAHPATPGQILRGEAAARYVVALLQGVYIILGTLLLFRVDWGGPLEALAILVLFAAVSAGAAMLLGAVGRTSSQVGAASIGIALVVAALGGSMLPIEIMPSAMQTVARFTPHAWAYDAFAEVIRNDGTLLDILPQLGVLAVMAAVFIALGGVLLRRTLERTA